MCHKVYNNLLVLEVHIMLIPSLMEMHNYTCKIPLVCMLDHITKTITCTTWPATHLHVHHNCTLSSYLPGHVCKWTHSAGFLHVIVPGGNAPGEDNNVEVDTRFKPLNEARWFLQEMVPLIKWFECWVGICLQDPEKKIIFQKWTSREPTGHSNKDIIWIMPMLGLSLT